MIDRSELKRITGLTLLVFALWGLSGCASVDLQIDMRKFPNVELISQAFVNEALIQSNRNQWEQFVAEQKASCENEPGCRFNLIESSGKQGIELRKSARIEDLTKSENVMIEHHKENGKESFRLQLNFDNDIEGGAFLSMIDGQISVLLPQNAEDVETNGTYATEDKRITWPINWMDSQTMTFSFRLPNAGLGEIFHPVVIGLFVLALLLLGVALFVTRRRARTQSPTSPASSVVPDDRS